MMRCWIRKFFLCFFAKRHHRSSPVAIDGSNRVVTSLTPVSHVFSPPLKLSLLRKVRCQRPPSMARQPQGLPPLSCLPTKRMSQTDLLRQSHRNASAITCYKRCPSLVALNFEKSHADLRHKPSFLTFRDRSPYCSRTKHLSKEQQSGDSLVHDDLQQSNRHRSKSTSSVALDHTIRFRPGDRLQNQHLSHTHSHEPQNINSITSDSPVSNETSFSSLRSTDFSPSPSDRRAEKTWKLQIHDDLNKDGSRHHVIHKDTEESIRQRRESKRAKRSEEKKRRIAEKVSNANQRWQKYSNIDYELVFFISRYYDQLPLCANCRRYFTTYRTNSLLDDPRASLDYAADEALRSAGKKSITLKQAAKSRLIQDYNKQTDLIFNLCDTCLNACEQIRNELKERNITRKLFDNSYSPTIDMKTMTPSELQFQELRSPLSPSQPVEKNDEPYSSSPTFSPSPSPTSIPIPLASVPIPSPPENLDLHQLYMNNLFQYHQLRLQQLYQQTQKLLLNQSDQRFCPTINDLQPWHHDFQACVKEMQYHCLESLRLQYPGYSLSLPYTPSSDPEYLSYRQQLNACDGFDQDHPMSSIHIDDHDRSRLHADDEHRSMDDRVTIDTCHGLIEYCNAPLDDFIRGLQVLKCLSTYSRDDC